MSMQTSSSGRALPPRIGRLVLCGNPVSIGGVFSPRIARSKSARRGSDSAMQPIARRPNPRLNQAAFAATQQH